MGRELNEAARRGQAQFDKAMSDYSRRVEEAFDRAAEGVTPRRILSDLQKLEKLLQDKTGRHAARIRELTQQIAIEKMAAPQAFKRIAEHVPSVSRAAGRSFSPSERSNLDPRYIANYLEQVKRVSSAASSPMMSQLVGEKVGAGLGPQIMQRNLQGEMDKLREELENIAILKKRGLIQPLEEEQIIGRLGTKYASLIGHIREINKDRARGNEIADRELSRQKGKAPGGAHRLYQAAPDFVAKAMNTSQFMNRLFEAEKGAAAGKPMSMGMRAASAGAEGLAGAMNRLNSAATYANMALAALMKFIEALDTARKVQASSIPALTVGSGQMAKGYRTFAQNVMVGNDEILQSIGSSGKFFPLMNASLKTMGTLGFRAADGSRALASENMALARSFMQVGIMGQAIGKDMDESQSMAADFARAFSLSGKGVEDFFRRYIAMTNVAKLASDEFTGAIGSMMDYTKLLGGVTAQATVGEMAALVGDMSDNAEKLMALGAFKTLLNKPIMQQAGLALATGGESRLAAFQTGGGGATPLGVLTESAGDLMKQVSKGLEGRSEPIRRLGMAQAAGQLVDPSLASYFMHVKGPLEDNELYQHITGAKKLNEDQVNKLIDDAKKQYDPATIGADAMVKNTTTLDKIFNLLDTFLKRYAISAAGRAAGLGGIFRDSESAEPEDMFKKTPN